LLLLFPVDELVDVEGKVLEDEVVVVGLVELDDVLGGEVVEVELPVDDELVVAREVLLWDVMLVAVEELRATLLVELDFKLVVLLLLLELLELE
jgi:hypothetical protein